MMRPKNTVFYSNGAHFLCDLRARIGDEVFYVFLKNSFTQKIATWGNLFSVLDAHPI